MGLVRNINSYLDAETWASNFSSRHEAFLNPHDIWLISLSCCSSQNEDPRLHALRASLPLFQDLKSIFIFTVELNCVLTKYCTFQADSKMCVAQANVEILLGSRFICILRFSLSPVLILPSKELKQMYLQVMRPLECTKLE